MNGQSGYISSGTNQLHYLKWGNGPDLLLAFHGYANTASIFAPLDQYLHDKYTIISFDLPHHGKSQWAEDALLTTKDLTEMVTTLMQNYRVNKVALIGYSMGGRVCLSILETMPASISKVVLLATDGLTVNAYYYFFTRTWLGNRIFRNLLSKPRFYLRIMDWLKDKKLANPSRHKFATHFLQTEEHRNFLLRVWPAMSRLIPAPAKLKATIRQHKIPIAIFMGAYDKIMPPLLGEKFKTGLDTVQLFVLEKGHHVLDHDSARQIAEYLL